MKKYNLIKPLLLGFLAAAVLAVGIANAQVAITNLSVYAPRILGPDVPGINGTEITPDNPAALGFVEFSMVALGMIDGEDFDNTNSTSNGTYDGNYLGGRYKGEGFVLALDYYAIGESPPTKDDATTNLQAAFLIGESLSLGIGYESTEIDNGNSDTESTTTLTLGVSLKFGEMFYAGFSMGSSDYERPLAAQTGDRSVTQYGFGAKSEGDDTLRWYAEYYLLDMDDIEDPTTPGAFIGPNGLTLTGISLQAVYSDILLGYTSYDIAEDQNPNREISGNTIDLGYMPKEGLSIVFRMLSVDVVDTGTNDTIETTSLTVGTTF